MAGFPLDEEVLEKLGEYISRNYGVATWILVKAYVEQLGVRDSEVLKQVLAEVLGGPNSPAYISTINFLSRFLSEREVEDYGGMV